jgi:uncharacterized protein
MDSLLGKFWATYWRSILLIIIGCWLLLELVARLGVEILWFQEVGYLSALWVQLGIKGLLGGLGAIVAAIYLLGNLRFARSLISTKYAPENRIVGKQPPIAFDIYRRRSDRDLVTKFKLQSLLPLTLGLSLLLAIILLHYLTAAIGGKSADSILEQTLPASILFDWSAIQQLLKQSIANRWIGGSMICLTIAIVVMPRFLLRSISLVISGAIGWVLSDRWMQVLPLLAPTSFDRADPVFGRDIGNYIFGLPVGELVAFAAIGICSTGFITVLLTYLLAENSLSQGGISAFSHQQKLHLDRLGGCLMLACGWSYWISCYELLYSPRGVSYGASYTDIAVQLPADRMLTIVALAVGGYLLWRSSDFGRKSFSHKPILVTVGLYLLLAISTRTIIPTIFQYLVVQPNELARETPYIKRTIASTREAFGLANIETNTFDPQANLTEKNIQDNDSTIQNIRLWDKQPLLATNRQLQQIRLYYKFLDADIDRYKLTNIPKISTDRQQVLIAARELDYDSVPKQVQTWVNEHLIYTHGYGFTVNPVNRSAAGGLPEYFVKDIGSNDRSPLNTSSEAVRSHIPIDRPRIYYGENTNTYVMTGTKVKELDYPSGIDNIYNVYDGKGGINIGTAWHKWLFAVYLHDWRMVLTPEFLPETKILFRRNLTERIKSIAPFLQYDRDPYLIAADPQNSKNPNYLYWIVDAYTTSNRYPYSDIGKEGINYIRNSVKIVVDAYDGSMSFYIADPQDPIVSTWAKVFPNFFKPLAAMPANFQEHLRYPQDFLKLQSERLMTYHMTDPQVFYNREDLWQIPTEVYGDKPRLVEPYYLISRLPNIPDDEFILFLPYTPQQRTNLVAWLAARSDGKNYGKLSLYTFPKQRSIYGPEQIEARINQDPVISQQISLWNRQGSRVIQGNLLIVPIEQSLIYVEPLYLEATQNQLPTLVRVVVAYENQIVMAQTLPQALKAIFQPPATPPAPIVRPVDG